MRAAFGKAVRKKIRTVFGEGAGHGVGIQNVTVQRIAGLIGFVHVHEAAKLLGAQMTMHEPLHVPDSFKGALGNFGDQRLEVRRTESAETGLRARAGVGVIGIERRAAIDEDQASVEVGFK